MGKILKQYKSKFILLTLVVIFTAGFLYLFSSSLNQNQIESVQAQTVPQISSYSGTAVHGQNITITGSNFGIKNPAAPLAWDDCSGTSLSAIWDRALPSQAGAVYNIAYHVNGFRNVSAPHNRTGGYISGGHAQAGYTNWNALAGPSVSVGHDIANGTESYYMSFYYRLDPLWPPKNGESASDVNHKTILISPYTGSSLDTVTYCGFNPHPENNSSYGLKCDNMSCKAEWPCDENGWCVNKDLTSNWAKYEYVGANVNNDTLGKMYVYQDNYLLVRGENCDCFRTTDASIHSMAIGYYWARCNTCNPTLGSNDAFRYFADVYMDITSARVVLANNQNYSQATIIEPQIPSAWSASSITAKVNLGRLSDTGTVYLFVFDASNNHNATGYPVVLGGSPSPIYLLPDLTKDRTINQSDFDLFKPLWGTNQADFNNDSKTDSRDFGIMMSEWGSY